MKRIKLAGLLAVWLGLGMWRAAGQDYHFDGQITRPVLENYLERAISFTELLHDELAAPANVTQADPRDNVRLILDAKAKFIGRALLLWGQESRLDGLLKTARPYAAALHRADPDLVLQGGAFEIVTTNIETVAIPARVFQAFDLPVTNRTFRYGEMLYADGHFVNHWGSGASVPDMSRLETRLWFYFLATSYVDAGLEAVHFGQVGLMDNHDPGHAGWLDLLGRVRAYARVHARRHLVICDAHAPTGGFVEQGRLLFDFHSFPLRIVAVTNQPYRGVLQVGYTDAIFQRSRGGLTPSGWRCEHLPYLVEFDNFGSHQPGQAGTWPYIWGWDEITWFALLPENERNQWLRYAWDWVKKTDGNGHLQMPGSRVLSPGKRGGPHWYWANTRSAACPQGFNTELTIRALWGTLPPAATGAATNENP